MATLIETLPQCIAAAAGLGTASFALVDATKAWKGGVSNCGFPQIERVVTLFFTNTEKTDEVSPLGLKQILLTLKANWLNGTDLGGQKAIAKSLLKLRLNSDTAAQYATVTKVDSGVLTVIAGKIAIGASLDTPEGDVWARFDLILTAILDQGYERADQIYRNSAKALSVIVAVALAIIGFYSFTQAFETLGLAILVGLAATPIAPIAKDLTSALAAGATVAKAFRK
ncbi:hypothetical protein [Pseudomonas mohnii]